MRLVMLNFSGNSSLLFSDNEFTDNWQLPENYKPHAYLGIVHGIAFTALKSYELWLFVCLASTERICTHQMLKSFAWESLSCEVMGVARGAHNFKLQNYKPLQAPILLFFPFARQFQLKGRSETETLTSQWMSDICWRWYRVGGAGMIELIT